jgi:cytochrome c oxidase assembly protein subunit 15
MSRSDSTKVSQVRAVRGWLITVAALIFLTLVVGGATRLAESGLSITEWKPVTGVPPPLSAGTWQDEFAKYQAIPQFILRSHIRLSRLLF